MCYLRIEKYEEKDNKKSKKKIVIRLGHDQNHEQDFVQHFKKYLNVTRLGHDHNHEQDFAQHIKKDLNDELKRCAVDSPKTKTGLIVDQVFIYNLIHYYSSFCLWEIHSTTFQLIMKIFFYMVSKILFMIVIMA